MPPGSALRLPGLDPDFGPAFSGLLPAFLFVALVGSAKSVAVAAAAQRLARRRSRAVDFRAVAAEGAGNLLAGLVGTMPTTPFAESLAAVEVTGVAARRVGVPAGFVFMVLAFLPKALALILAIPSAVVAASSP